VCGLSTDCVKLIQIFPTRQCVLFFVLSRIWWLVFFVAKLYYSTKTFAGSAFLYSTFSKKSQAHASNFKDRGVEVLSFQKKNPKASFYKPNFILDYRQQGTMASYTWDDFTVKEIRAQCRVQGAKQDGLKADLIARLTPNVPAGLVPNSAQGAAAKSTPAKKTRAKKGKQKVSNEEVESSSSEDDPPPQNPRPRSPSPERYNIQTFMGPLYYPSSDSNLDSDEDLVPEVAPPEDDTSERLAELRATELPKTTFELQIEFVFAARRQVNSYQRLYLS